MLERIKILYLGFRKESFDVLLTLNRLEFIDVLTFKDSFIERNTHIYEKCKKIRNLWVLEKKRKEKTLEFLKKILTENSYNLTVSVGFPYIIPKEILELGKKKDILFLNLHPHILPKWKGYNAIRESFWKGETTFGATLHFMTEKVDEGQIISQYQFQLEKPSLDLIYNLTFGVAEPLTLYTGLKKLFGVNQLWEFS